jgi:hypothetical protein
VDVALSALPTRLPWQAVHCSMGSERFWNECPCTKPFPAKAGRLTWQPPQLVWQAEQWFARASSTCDPWPLPARLPRTLGKVESVTWTESLAVATTSAWQSPQACAGRFSLGMGSMPAWAAVLSAAAGSPPWQLSQAIPPCVVARNSRETRTFACGSNGATEPPQPAPDCIADFLAFEAPRLPLSLASSR